MASSIFSYSLISTFKPPISPGRMMSSTNNPSPCLKLPPTLAPISGRMMSSTTTVSCLDNPSPCLMLPPTLEGFGGNMAYNFYDLAQNKVISFNNNKRPGKGTKIVGSSHGWLALFDELNGSLILTNPATRRHVNLPPSERVSKVIISCDAEQEECQAMMIGDLRRLAFCRLDRSPTKWTPIGALKRRPPHHDYQRFYEDQVYSSRHKLFFCVTETTKVYDLGDWHVFSGPGDDLEGWDVSSDPPKLRWENREDLLSFENYGDWSVRAGYLLEAEANEDWISEAFKYLVFVEQADQLFLVTRHLTRRMAPDGCFVADMDKDICPYKTIAFDVHRIDRELDGEGGRLSHVDGGSLGGLAMFVGLNHSFAVLATEANGLKPNSIYFIDDKLLTPPERWVHKKYGGHDIGIFDYENKTISSCYYPCDLQSFKRIMPPPIWFTPTHY